MPPFNQKQILCLWLCVCLTLVHAYDCTAQFTDDFSDGDFTTNPVWAGNDSKFSITTNRLQLTAPAVADKAYLSTPSAAVNNAVWEFVVQLNFNPSSANLADVYLVSDNASLTSSLNGYFVRIGNTSDEVSLYKQTGTTVTEIIDGLDTRLTGTTIVLKVRVMRDHQGNWRLYSDVGLTGTYTQEGTQLDSVKNDVTYLSSSYFGIVCTYTLSNAQNFFFDDFSVTGDPYIDPSQPTDYKDVIITEIFADPSPVIGLPEAEFVELFNRSDKIINLNGWRFTDGSSTALLSGILNPNEYRIITATSSAPLFTAYGSTLGAANFPTLNNSSDNLVLKRNDDVLIDAVSYSDAWYRDDDKKQGGYTLELIDPANPCGEEDNWTASESPAGGTPGAQNSVYENKPDLTGPKLISAFLISPTTLRLTFNEKLSAQLPSTNQLVFLPQNIAINLAFEDATLRSWIITLSTPVQAGVLYAVQVTEAYDCNGNEILQEFATLEFALPEEAEEKDVLINEVLFNPRPTGVDFVEVYNNSDKYINLKSWSISNYENGTIANARNITTNDLLLPPHMYKVFTTSRNIVMGQYVQAKEENIFVVAALPSFNDDSGTVALVSAENVVVDFFSYTDDYHTPFLKDTEGVSLERISFAALTNNAANWHSASSTVGFATPGYINSAARGGILADNVRVDPEIFEPINGQPAFTQIHYNFNSAGFVANLKILDFHGREIKRIANNATLGTTGFFRWDGDTANGTKARTGYYVLWMEVFNTHGKVESFRKRIVVASRNH